MSKKNTKTNKTKQLKEFQELFSDLYDKENDYLETPKMENLIKSSGCDVISSVYIGEWSGDALMIVKKGKEFGLLMFGYGSCSGCDALQACGNFEELFDLREALCKSIIWKEYSEFIDYLKNKDWNSEFYCAGDKKNLKLIKTFIKESNSKMLMSHLSGI